MLKKKIVKKPNSMVCMCDLIFCGYLTYKLPLCKVMKGCTLNLPVLMCMQLISSTQFDGRMLKYIYCRDLNVDLFKPHSAPNMVIEIDRDIK